MPTYDSSMWFLGRNAQQEETEGHFQEEAADDVEGLSNVPALNSSDVCPYSCLWQRLTLRASMMFFG
jgi:hypothetical protein